MSRKSSEEQTREWREEGFQKGVLQGRAETIRKGRRQGTIGLLAYQLKLRFGPLPEDMDLRLRKAWPWELKAWSTHILNAFVLDDVFRSLVTDSLQDLAASLRERIEEWKDECHREGFQAGLPQGHDDGIQEGRQEGAASLLTHQLEHYFGPLPEDTRSHLQAANIREIMDWAERLFGATTLDDVFQ